MKVAIWCWVGIGLLPCALIAWQYFTYRQMSAIEQQLPYARSGSIHHRYFRVQIGLWPLEMYPRLWAFALLAAGIVAIVVSLVILLHVRSSESAA
jgi:hypothetical protein